ncbi:hypothetical protein [Geitlerinema sp. PCC 7407]|nr:hypothetical protein [Geitlerinema sp. PCC 7407]
MTYYSRRFCEGIDEHGSGAFGSTRSLRSPSRWAADLAMAP